MNSVQLTGRLTRDPDIRYTDGGLSIARFTLAVNRRFKQENGPSADFINCIAFGKTAEFIEKYFIKGRKMDLNGRIQTGSYTDNDGNKRYTTDVVVEAVEFGESKGSGGNADQHGNAPMSADASSDGFMNIPDGIDDDELPFS